VHRIHASEGHRKAWQVRVPTFFLSFSSFHHVHWHRSRLALQAKGVSIVWRSGETNWEMDPGYTVRALPAMAPLNLQDPVFSWVIRTNSINGTRNILQCPDN